MDVQVLVLADDLTGALEAGAKFAESGLASIATTERNTIPEAVEHAGPVLVIDTETRHLCAIEAHRIVHGLASAAKERRIEYLFKKTDSTLRGNIGSELAALADVYPGFPIIYAPAYPRMGRTVRGGALFIDGVPVSRSAFAIDRLNPSVEDHIPTLLGRAGLRMPIHSIEPEALRDSLPPAVYVVDGIDEEDVRLAARVFTASRQFRLAAGPAGFAHHLAEFLGPGVKTPPSLPPIESCIIVGGSRHPASMEQVRHALANGWPVMTPFAAADHAAGPRWVILEYAPADAADELDFAVHLGSAARQALSVADFDAIAVFGGDTARAVVDTLACSQLRPLGEPIPGVPVSRVEPKALRNIRGRDRDLYLVSKAGGFGAPDLLDQLKAKLSRQ